MRSLALHYGTIQIASIAGESRRITVSGLARARLLWLFRNFSILEFPVLSRKQQQLIYEMWNSGLPVPSKAAPRDVIGTVEAFSPELSEQISSHKPGRPRVRFTLRSGLRSAASWRAFSILLLGAAMYLGPRYLPPKHPRTPQTQIAASADEKQRSRSTPSSTTPSQSRSSESNVAPPAAGAGERVSAQAAAPVAALPGVAAPVVGVLGRNGVPSAPAIGGLGRNLAPPVLAPDLPEAMAHDTAAQTPPLKRRSVAGPQEVLIRVRVDAAGQAQSFQVLQGDPEKISQALKVARDWNFKPCPGGEACEQVLKFTDYGDSSRMRGAIVQGPSSTQTTAMHRSEPTAAIHPITPTGAPGTPAFHPNTPTTGAPGTPELPKRPNIAGPQEVLIRVKVNAAGQPQTFHVLRGDEDRVPKALEAARLWNFKPCVGGGACEQVLKYIDYGDSHRVQRVE